MKNAIEIKNLFFGYAKDKRILNGVDLSIEEGAIVAILGKNGCGKSTLLDCMIGFNDYNQGTIKIDGIDVKSLLSKEFAKKVAYISQNTIINIDYTVLEFILFGRNCHLPFGNVPNESDYEIAKKNAEKLGILHLLSKEINKLSGGERQLVFIARALTQESKIVVMDEPAASLDYGNQIRLFEIIKWLQCDGKTVVFTIHNPEYVIKLNCDVAVMKDGKVIQCGKAKDCITRELLEDIYEIKHGEFDA